MSEPLTENELLEMAMRGHLVENVVLRHRLSRMVDEIRHLRAENERLTAAMLLLQSPKVES